MVAAAMAQVTAVAWIQTTAWELLRATDTAKREKKKQNKNKSGVHHSTGSGFQLEQFELHTEDSDSVDLRGFRQHRNKPFPHPNLSTRLHSSLI